MSPFLAGPLADLFKSFCLYKEEYKGKHSFHQIKGEEKEGGIFNFCLTNLFQSKFSKSGKEELLWIGLQGKRAKSVTGFRTVKWKMYLIYLNFSLVSNPLALQFSALFCYTCKLKVLPFNLNSFCWEGSDNNQPR